MLRRMIVVLSVASILSVQPILAPTGPVSWNPDSIDAVLGLGDTQDIWVSFFSTTSMTNVDLWVVPELQPFMTLEPNHFDAITASIGYNVRIRFTIPHTAIAGIHEGNIHVRTGRRTYPAPLSVQLRIEEAIELIGPEGGTITTESGIQAYIPAGALDSETVIGISSVPIAQLRIDASQGLDILGAVQFYTSGQVLKQNAELSIPAPDNISQSTKISLGKIVALMDKDLIVAVDTARIEGGFITSNQPAFPGAIDSGIYPFYAPDTFCGVPTHDSFFEGKIVPTCSDMLYADIYLKFIMPQIFAQNDMLYDSINGVLSANNVSQEALYLARQLSTITVLGNKSFQELMTKAGGIFVHLNEELAGDIASVWWDLAFNCLLPVTANPVTCEQTLIDTSIKTVLNTMTLYGVVRKTQLMNENLLTERYLALFYSYGGSQLLVAQSLGLTSDTDLRGILNAIAGTLIGNPWWWPYSDFNYERVSNVIMDAQESVIAVARSVDDDRDFIVNSKDNCPENYNPDQADSNENGIGDACEGPPSPQFVGGCEMPGLTWDITVKDNYAYVLCGKSIQVVDISVPSSPHIVGACLLVDQTQENIQRGILISGNYVLVCGGRPTLEVYNIANPISPARVFSSEPIIWGMEMFVSGSQLFIFGFDGFLIYDISNPAQPLQLSRTDTPGIVVGGGTVQGNFAYVVTSNAGLLVFDLNNPYHPIQVSSYLGDPSHHYDRVRVREGYAFICSDSVYDTRPALIVLDVRNPSAPVQVGSCGGFYQLEADLTLWNDYALMTSLGNSTFRVVDIANPQTPVLLSSTNVYPYSFYMFELKNGYVYGAAVFSGLGIFKLF